MNNQEISPEIREFVLDALDRTYRGAREAVEKSGNQPAQNLSQGVQDFLVNFIIQLLIELKVIDPEKVESVRNGLLDLIKNYKGKKGEG